MSSPSQVVILVEDQRHQSFVRQFLYRAGFFRHHLRLVSLPSGRGSGEQWVRERYANEVIAYRTRSASAKTALIVAIDADTWSVNDRLEQLQQTLRQADLDDRKNGEAIVHLVPKRNIETWILCLTGDDVDEHSDYRATDVDDRIKTAAATFFDWSRRGSTPDANCVASLLSAIPEAARLG